MIIFFKPKLKSHSQKTTQ